MTQAKNYLLLAMCFSIMAVPVKAESFLDGLKNYTGITVTNWNDLESKRAALESQVNEALRTGRLTAAQASDFKAQLKVISDAEAQAQATNRRMGFRENIQFTQEITAISSQIEQAMSKQVTSLPDVDALQKQLQEKIANAQASGHLTSQDATTLKAQLQHIDDIEAAYKKESGGALNPRQIELLVSELNTTQAQIDQQVKLGQSAIPQLNSRRAAILKRITDASAAGKLSATDAAAIKLELDQNAAKQAGFAGANNILTGSQVLMLASQLDAADAHLDAKLIPATPGTTATAVSTTDLDAGRAQLDTKIKQLVSTGVIPAEVASELNVELEQIATLEHAYKASTGGITAAQVQQLGSNLDRLNYRISRQTRMASGGNNDGGGYGRGGGNSWGGYGGRGGDGNSGPGGGFGGGGNNGPGGGFGNGGNNGPGGGFGNGGNNGPGGGFGNGGNNGPGGGFGNSEFEGGAGGGFGGGAAGGYSNGPRRGDRDGRGSGHRRQHNDESGNLPTSVNNGSSQETSSINLPVISQKDFNDVAGYWAQPYVTELANRGVIGGFPDSSFKPNAEITRSQFASIVSHALNLPTASATNNFTDVPAKHWAAASIAAVANAGLVGGFPDGTFHPEDKLTRAQALVILAKALHSTATPNSAALDPYSDKQAVPAWASDSVTSAAQAHIIANFPDAAQIRPNALATRGEVAALMYQTLTALGANLPNHKVGVL